LPGTVQFKPLGDTAVRIGLAQQVEPGLHRLVHGLCRAIERARLAGVIEAVPSYTAVTVVYQPGTIRYADLCRRLRELCDATDAAAEPAGREVMLPVCYGGTLGPDLVAVAAQHGLTQRQVIELHTAGEYLVYMLGFAPGFPYLSGLPERLATPRLTTPRQAVPAGSVGIGGGQTGVYPIETPGGWWIIGHTPVRLFDPLGDHPFLLSPGDKLRFAAVDEARHAEIARAVAGGTYRADIRQPRES
jgi:inhibitor of KinA